MPVTETKEEKAETRKRSAAMPLTVKNDSKAPIEIAFKGEGNVVKVGDKLSGVKSDFFPSDLFRVGRIKGVNITTDSSGAPKKEKAPKE